MLNPQAQESDEARRELERYRTLFDTMDVGFCTIEMLYDETGKANDWRFLTANPAFEANNSIKDVAGKTIVSLAPGIEPKWFEIYDRVAQTGEPERHVEHSEALGIWFEIYAFRIENREVAVLFSDVTPRKKAEAERERLLKLVEGERERLAYMFEKAPAFVAVLHGPEHVFELTNAAYQQLIGHRNVVGKTIREGLPEITGQGYFELLDRVFQTGEPYLGKESAVELQNSPDGPYEKRFVDFIFQPIYNADRQVTGIFVHGVDITEQVEAKLAAEHANRLKDEFLATLSHELRTPLNAVLGWTQIMLDQDLDEEERLSALRTIERNARAQHRLIEDILDVSRIVSGKMRLQIQIVDLVNVITAAIETARPGADANNIAFDTLLNEDARKVSGDYDRLQQVVWNLLSNAVKFSPKKTRVEVKLERVDSNVQISIKDQGKGIQTEFLPYVFDRFRQSDGSMTRRQGGLGLGLAIVRQIVELHGGSVSVHSAGLGHGSTFTIRLPLLSVVPDSLEEADPGPIALPGAVASVPRTGSELTDLGILIVDDEVDSRNMLEAVLVANGATVRSADSAAAALEWVRMEPFDLLISDIGMPEEDGFSLIAKIRKLGYFLPAIALTAYARSEDRVKALRSGFQTHIAKPVNHSELIATILALLESRRS